MKKEKNTNSIICYCLSKQNPNELLKDFLNDFIPASPERRIRSPVRRTHPKVVEKFLNEFFYKKNSTNKNACKTCFSLLGELKSKNIPGKSSKF